MKLAAGQLLSRAVRSDSTQDLLATKSIPVCMLPCSSVFRPCVSACPSVTTADTGTGMLHELKEGVTAAATGCNSHLKPCLLDVAERPQAVDLRDAVLAERHLRLQTDESANE